MTNRTLDAHPHAFTEIALVARVESLLAFETLVEDLWTTFFDTQETFERGLVVLDAVVGLVFEGEELEELRSGFEEAPAVHHLGVEETPGVVLGFLCRIQQRNVHRPVGWKTKNKNID